MVPDRSRSGRALILGLDTSEKTASLALVDGEDILAEVMLSEDRRHETGLGKAMREVLASADVDAAGLSAIAVGIGPGSFTGVRIGVTFAKTLAFVLKCPLVGLSGLCAVAADSGVEGQVAVMRHAHTDRVYGAVFDLDDSPARVVRDVDLWDPAKLLDGLPAGTLVSCPEGQRWDDLCSDAGLQRGSAVAGVSAATLSRIASRHLAAGLQPHDHMTLAPLYCQVSAPERPPRSA